MNKWGILITILGTAAVAVLGFIAVQVMTIPPPAAENPNPVVDNSLEERRIELERERLAVEALRLKAQIQEGLIQAEASLDKVPVADPAVAQDKLVDAIVALAEDRENADPGEKEVPAVQPVALVDSPPPALQNFEPDLQAFDDFYEPLEPYGDWFESDGYGSVWQPDASYVSNGWAPYTNGSWGYSDYGWTWASNDPFGWACDHYGRWLYISRHGWVWVPGRQWAPAWVSWRTCDTHIGWAPLPPCASWNRSIGIGGWVDAHCGIGPGRYHFVTHANFGSRNCRSLIVDRSHNVHLVGRSRNITRLHFDRNCVNNHGPRFDDAHRRSQHGINKLQIDAQAEERRAKQRFADARGSGKSERVLRNLPAGAKADRGWDVVGDRAEQSRLRKQIFAEARGSLHAEEASTPRSRSALQARNEPQTRGKALTAITKRPQATQRKTPEKLPARAEPVVKVVQEKQARPPKPLPVAVAKQATPPKADPVKAREVERKLPEHFVAEQARRDETLAEQRALEDQRQRQIADRRASEQEAQQRIEQHIREREAGRAALQRAEQARRDRAGVASVNRQAPSKSTSKQAVQPTRSNPSRSTSTSTSTSSRSRAAEQAAAQQRLQREQQNQRDLAARQQQDQQRQRDQAARAKRESDQRRASENSKRAAQDRQRQLAAAQARRDNDRRNAEKQQRARAQQDAQRRQASENAARANAARAEASRRESQKQAQQAQQQRQQQAEQSKRQEQSRSGGSNSKRSRSR